MEQASAFYSVIIPHKNSLQFLERLVGSIPERSDLEIIIVDDHSNTVSADDWDQFRKSHPHVRLFLTRESGGAGFARNIGLSHATGKWVIFADADDFFYPHAFDYFDKWSESESDLIFFLCDSRDGTTLEPCADRMGIIRKNINAGNANGLRFNSLVPWGKMIKRSVIENNGIRFDETEVSNDVMFSMRLGLHASKVAIHNETLYCCTKNMGSLHFHRNTRRIKTRLQVYKKANDFLHQHGLDDYRLPFNRSAYPHLKYFIPGHPVLLIKYIWKIRYKDDTMRYFKEVLSKLRSELLGHLG